MSVFGRVGASLLFFVAVTSCDGGTEIVREVPYFPDTGGSFDGDDDQDTSPVDVYYAAVAPELYQLTHNRGPVAGGTILGLTGAGFRDGVKVKFGSNDGQVLGVSDAGHLVVKTPAGVAGATDVTIVNLDGGSTVFARAFTYYEPDPNAPSSPALLETIPSAGPSTGGTVALLRGSNFQTGAVFFIDWKVIASASVTSVENATIVTPALDVGAVDLAVTNPDGLSAQLDAGFSVFAPTSGTEETKRPQITGVDPSAGSVEGGLTVTVTGSYFTQGSKLLIGGRLAQTWTVTSEDKGTFVTPPHDAGLVDIVITDSQGNSGVRQGGFLYFVNPPVIYRVEPSSGPVDGGNTVTIQGKFLSQGMTVLIGGKPCTGVVVGAGDGTGTTSTFATCTAPEGDGPGPVTVEVGNPDGLGGQLPGGYTYLSPAPKIDAVEPETGPLEGGYLAVI